MQPSLLRSFIPQLRNPLAAKSELAPARIDAREGDHWVVVLSADAQRRLVWSMGLSFRASAIARAPGLGGAHFAKRKPEVLIEPGARDPLEHGVPLAHVGPPCRPLSSGGPVFPA
jgi:hypothetical protein